MEITSSTNLDDSIMEFAVRLADLRREEGRKLKTYKQMSDEIYQMTGTYISHTQLSKYVKMETGEVPLIYPKVNIVLAIAKYYDVSIEYLMGLSGTKKYSIEYKEGDKLFGLSDEAMDTLVKMQTHTLLPFPDKYKNYSESDFVSFLIVHFAIKFEQAIISYFYALEDLNKHTKLYFDNGKTVKAEYMHAEARIINDYQECEQAVYSQKYIITQLIDTFLDDLTLELTKKEADE